MLVLSRRPTEKVLLPSVPAAIKVISAQAGLVRLGIEAPPHIPILREELYNTDRAAAAGVAGAGHAARHRLNNLILGLALLRRQLADVGPAVRQTLDGLEEELAALTRVVTTADDVVVEAGAAI